ncbi:MAG: hypothetical protein Rubg2KO_28060 [Rubricoccaceae bacterium]
MTDLIREYLPHAPDMGLFVAPEIPDRKLVAALGDYAVDVDPDDVLALYDATRLGSAKDGAVFLADRVVFQNNDLQTPRPIRYEDIVGVESKRKLLGGRSVNVDLNRGRATVTETIDFSGQPAAAEYVERFLREAMMRSVRSHTDGPTAPTSHGTDREAVRDALHQLVQLGRLSPADEKRMLDVLD